MSKAYKEICPCKDCGRRKINCHSICKDYRKWKKNGCEIEKRPFFVIRRKRK